MVARLRAAASLGSLMSDTLCYRHVLLSEALPAPAPLSAMASWTVDLPSFCHPRGVAGSPRFTELRIE